MAGYRGEDAAFQGIALLDLFKDAPITFRKAVKKAEEHLMKARDNETTDEEIKSILGKQFLLSDDDFQE